MLSFSLRLLGVFVCLGASALASDPIELKAETRAKCLSILKQALESDEFWPAMHAAEALTLDGHEAVVLEHLKQRSTDNDQERCGLAREAIRAGDNSPLPILFEILDKPNSNGHTHAAESLFKVGKIGNGQKLRAAMSQDEVVKLRLMAAAALVRGGDAAALDTVRAALSDSDFENRKIAVWILGQIGTEEDLERIRDLPPETDPLAAAYVTNALANLGDTAARKQLGKNLTSDDPAIRTYSAEFAGHCGATELQSVLEDCLDDENLDTRVRAAQSLLTLAQR